MVVKGDCMSPEIRNNDLAYFDKHEPVKAGDTVMMLFRPELVKPGQMQAQVKRLVTNVPHWVKFPFEDHPKSDVLALVIAEMLNPPRQFTVRCRDLLALHKCIGVKPAEVE